MITGLNEHYRQLESSRADDTYIIKCESYPAEAYKEF